MTTTDDADWEMFAVWEAMKKFLNTHQGKDENVPDYRRRFEANADAVKELMGDKILYQFVRQSPGYLAQTGADEKREYLESLWERLLANGFLHNVYRKKYQQLIDDMNKKYALKHLPFSQRNEYPMTLENAALIVERHDVVTTSSKGDSEKLNKKKSGESNTNSGSGQTANGMALAQTGATSQRGGRKCYVCGDPQHVSNESAVARRSLVALAGLPSP